MSAAELEATLRVDLAAIGCDPGPDDFCRRVLEYASLLAKWNAHIRLVGPSDLNDIVREQVVDACGFIPAIDELAEPAWWDVGAGGGLPGVILALRFPERRFILVEPIHKKTAFLHQAVQHLGLTNAHVHTGRVTASGAVEPPLDRYPAPFPTAALSRATLGPEAWLATAHALVGPGGLALVALTDHVPPSIGADPASRPAGLWRWRVPATSAPRTLVARRF